MGAMVAFVPLTQLVSAHIQVLAKVLAVAGLSVTRHNVVNPLGCVIFLFPCGGVSDAFPLQYESARLLSVKVL